jgi:hypothetical protein
MKLNSPFFSSVISVTGEIPIPLILIFLSCHIYPSYQLLLSLFTSYFTFLYKLTHQALAASSPFSLSLTDALFPISTDRFFPNPPHSITTDAALTLLSHPSLMSVFPQRRRPMRHWFRPMYGPPTLSFTSPSTAMVVDEPPTPPH